MYCHLLTKSSTDSRKSHITKICALASVINGMCFNLFSNNLLTDIHSQKVASKSKKHTALKYVRFEVCINANCVFIYFHRIFI